MEMKNKNFFQDKKKNKRNTNEDKKWNKTNGKNIKLTENRLAEVQDQ